MMTHWMPKTGSYTIRLNRRGDIGESKPASQIEQTFEQLTERARRAQVEIARIDQMLPSTCGDANKAKLLQRKFQLEAELRNIRGPRLQAYLPRYAGEFLSAARLILDESTLKKIDAVVVSRVGVPPRHWQRFLGDNGFGKANTTTYVSVPEDAT